MQAMKDASEVSRDTGEGFPASKKLSFLPSPPSHLETMNFLSIIQDQVLNHLRESHETPSIAVGHPSDEKAVSDVAEEKRAAVKNQESANHDVNHEEGSSAQGQKETTDDALQLDAFSFGGLSKTNSFRASGNLAAPLSCRSESPSISLFSQERKELSLNGWVMDFEEGTRSLVEGKAPVMLFCCA